VLDCVSLLAAVSYQPQASADNLSLGWRPTIWSVASLASDVLNTDM
jgi:hypothetical protein